MGRPKRQSASPETERRVVAAMRAGGYDAAKVVGPKFGLSAEHARDLFRVDRERRGFKIYHKRFTEEQREWAIRQLETGVNVHTVARTLGVSHTLIDRMVRLEVHKRSSQFSPYSPPTSPVEATEDDESSAEITNFCFLEELRRLEAWVTDVRKRIRSHEQHTPGKFAWKRLEKNVESFSSLVETMRRVEMRRTRELQRLLGTLSRDMGQINVSLSQFGAARGDHPKVSLTLRSLYSNSPVPEVKSSRREETSSSGDTDSSWSS